MRSSALSRNQASCAEDFWSFALTESARHGQEERWDPFKCERLRCVGESPIMGAGGEGGGGREPKSPK